jgi:hypothetical protein
MRAIVLLEGTSIVEFNASLIGITFKLLINLFLDERTCQDNLVQEIVMLLREVEC